MMDLLTVRADTLGRFLAAQDHKNAYLRARSEIFQGRKRTHWMWFVFPQLRALAKSETAEFYGIADETEAQAYIADVKLRARLGECTMGILKHRRLMLTYPDNHKLQACMTLFRSVVADPALPNAVLEKFYGGQPHQLTLDVLAGKTIPQQKRPPAAGRVEVNWKRGVRWRHESMVRGEVAAFVRSLKVPESTVKVLVDEWMADQERAREEGWEAHADSTWHAGN